MRLLRIGTVVSTVLAGAALAGCAQVNGAAADPSATAVPSVTADDHELRVMIGAILSP